MRGVGKPAGITEFSRFQVQFFVPCYVSIQRFRPGYSISSCGAHPVLLFIVSIAHFFVVCRGPIGWWFRPHPSISLSLCYRLKCHDPSCVLFIEIGCVMNLLTYTRRGALERK